MSEPYYIITKLTESATTSSTGAITESELKRRLDVIIDKPNLNADGAIDIILHGEGKEVDHE